MARSRPGPPKRLSESSLEASALAYLGRFSTSTANLRRVLARKVMRSAAFHDDDPAPLLAAIDALIARYVRSGVLNDVVYAEAVTVTHRRRGGSARAIAARLAAKGVAQETVTGALAQSEPGAERTSAAAFARRRRLGPFRAKGRAEHRARDLAALGRAGFDFRTAALVVDAADPEALAEILRDEAET